jgi:hypothetical protein
MPIPSVIMLNVVMLSVTNKSIMLNAIMLSVFTLNVMAPNYFYLKKNRKTIVKCFENFILEKKTFFLPK